MPLFVVDVGVSVSKARSNIEGLLILEAYDLTVTLVIAYVASRMLAAEIVRVHTD